MKNRRSEILSWSLLPFGDAFLGREEERIAVLRFPPSASLRGVGNPGLLADNMNGRVEKGRIQGNRGS